MVARQFIVHHNDSQFLIDYDTNDGLEVLKFQIFSLTSVPPDEQKILVEDQNLIVTESSDLESITDKLRLLSVIEGEESGEQGGIFGREEEALFFQQFQAGEDGREFDGRIRPYVKQVLMYEDPVRQEAARKSVPVDELEEKALVSLAKEGKFQPSKEEKDYAFLLQLLFWFKQSFSWVNSPPCDNCGRGTSNIGMGAALPSEIEYGASRVELYRCNYCSSISRFPRYNDPLKVVVESGLIASHSIVELLGYESRLILDFTDHVWTECFSYSLGRWMHLDPCEGVFDNPLLYEKGWNKKLNYVIAIAKDGVYDVTKRYTRKWHEVLSRRIITTEATASSVLSSITNECRARYSSEVISFLSHRDKKELEQLEADLHCKVNDSLSLPGRQSGAVEWRISRCEVGSNGLSSSSCPKRKCVDGHVTDIYNALSILLFQFFDNSYPKTEIIEVLMTLRKLLLDLKNSPFRARRSFVNLNTAEISDKMMSSIEGLIASMSLKWELENDGRACVFLAGDPVQTSLALPVALDSLDEIIDTLRSDNHFGKDIIKFPKSNRLSSGEVFVSGEELPIGIATSAFDGIHLSKWEEPNGAKGCWLLYKVIGDQMHELESYELMSANDAPERDPMDWILEGSDDGGISWYVIDKQSSQLFGKRFQRRSFRVDSIRKSNAFRFHFKSVRDSKTQSRFQIGSIDFYAKLS